MLMWPIKKKKKIAFKKIPCQLLNIKKLLINFNEIKKKKLKLKTIKYINSDLIHFEQRTQSQI